MVRRAPIDFFFFLSVTGASRGEFLELWRLVLYGLLV